MNKNKVLQTGRLNVFCSINCDEFTIIASSSVFTLQSTNVLFYQYRNHVQTQAIFKISFPSLFFLQTAIEVICINPNSFQLLISLCLLAFQFKHNTELNVNRTNKHCMDSFSVLTKLTLLLQAEMQEKDCSSQLGYIKLIVSPLTFLLA